MDMLALARLEHPLEGDHELGRAEARNGVVGFTLWESAGSRYQEVEAVVDGRVLSAPVTFDEAR